MAHHATLLLLNHFDLTTICGTTVMLGEVLRLAPTVAPGVDFRYLSYEPHPDPTGLLHALAEHSGTHTSMIAINAHIEVAWHHSVAAFAWCKQQRIPSFVFVHDYWPHHREAVHTLVHDLEARLLASTPFIAESLAQHGFPSEVIEVGVPLLEPAPEARQPLDPPRLLSAGRLVPRKRLADIPQAFALSGRAEHAHLYLRALPSNVFHSAADTEQLNEIQQHIEQHHLRTVTVDTYPADRPHYADFAAYVCPSSYEGFSMSVIEAAYASCPPLMSDIPPHRRNATVMFGQRAEDFLFSAGDVTALAALIRDELDTRRRKAFLDANLDAVQATIYARWSLTRLTTSLAALVSRLV